MADAVAIKINADTKKAQKGLKDLGGAFGRLDKLASRAGAATSGFGLALAAVGAGAAAAAAALVANANQVSALGDEYARTARVLGVTNKETQQLSFLAGRARVDFSKLSAGLKRLQRNMLDSVSGNTRMADMFTDLGIKVQGADGRLRNVMDVSRDLADVIKEMGQGADATGTLMTLLGRAGTETADIFLQGSAVFAEADERLRALGAYMSDELIASSEAYQNSIVELKSAWQGVRNELAARTIPLLTDLVTMLTNDVIPAGRSWAESLSSLPEFFEDLGAAALDAVPGIDGATDALERMREKERAIESERKKQRATIARGTGAGGIPEDLVILPDGRVVTESEAARIKVRAASSTPGTAKPKKSRPVETPEQRSAAAFSAMIGTGTGSMAGTFGEGRDLMGGLIGDPAELLAEKQRLADEEAAIARELTEQLRAEQEKRREDARATSEAQVFLASEAFGAVGDLAQMAQSMVEDSYFGQTRAGKTAAKVLFLAGKAAAIAQATVNAALAISNTLATVAPPPAAAAAAAAMGIAAGAQIAVIAGTAIQGIADAGLPPGALKNAGLNQHTVLAVRNDEMVMDPTGTSEITKMLALQRRQLEMGVMGRSNEAPQVVVEMDGRRLTSALSPHMTRAVEDGHDFRRDVRFAGAL